MQICTWKTVTTIDNFGIRHVFDFRPTVNPRKRKIKETESTLALGAPIWRRLKVQPAAFSSLPEWPGNKENMLGIRPGLHYKWLLYDPHTVRSENISSTSSRGALGPFSSRSWGMFGHLLRNSSKPHKIIKAERSFTFRNLTRIKWNMFHVINNISAWMWNRFI